MTTRADYITQATKAPDFFSDFLDDLTPHPVTGDVARVRNEQSIKQAVRNIVLTNLGERPFQSYIGSDVNKSLFEFDDFVTASNIKLYIENAIKNCEPRVNLLDVVVSAFPIENKIGINIVFSIVNSNVVQDINLILRRVR